MDRGGAYWATISSWCTPIIFFCVLNLMVATIYMLSSSNKQKKNNQESEVNDPAQFFRVSSFLERVKSINLSRSYHAEHEEITQHAEPVESEVDEETEEGHVARTMSDSVVVESVVKRDVKMMKKSQSAKIVRVQEEEGERETEKQRVPATTKERTVPFSEDEAVDAKADDFINRFKQQLKLQRIESLLKYRGASK